MLHYLIVWQGMKICVVCSSSRELGSGFWRQFNCCSAIVLPETYKEGRSLCGGIHVCVLRPVKLTFGIKLFGSFLFRQRQILSEPSQGSECPAQATPRFPGFPPSLPEWTV